MKANAIIAIASAFCAGVTGAQISETNVPPDRLSFYEVPLVCPAAPEIGCGSRSKPILLQLEREPSVKEAWLNRPGTIMAVVWKPETKRKERAATFEAVAKKGELKARELTGAARRKALNDFHDRSGWLRGTEVDRLSEEEADVIAKRWIGRFGEKIALSEDKAKALQQAFAAQIKRQLTGQATREEAREQMLEIARQKLSEKDVAVLLEAFSGAPSPKN